MYTSVKCMMGNFLPCNLSLGTLSFLESGDNSPCCALQVLSKVERFRKAEKQVYDAVIIWIQHDNERRVLLPEVLDLVRLPLLSYQELKDIARNSIISQDINALRIVQQGLCYKEYQKNHLQRPELSRKKIQPRKSYAGILFYLGGQGSNGIPGSLVRIYSWPNTKWDALDELLSIRGHCGCLWYKGAIVRIGGSKNGKCLSYSDVYSPFGYTTLKIQNMAIPRRRLGVCVIKNVIYAIGGLCDGNSLNTVEAYNIKDRKWLEKAPMQYCRGDVAVAELRGCVIAIGGNAGARSLRNCELYNPLNNDWHSIAPLNIPRHGAGAVTVDDFVYVFGGFNDYLPLKTVEKYDPEKNQWMKLSGMKYPRGEAGVATVGRQVFVIGGKNNRMHLGSMEIYNVDDDSWEEGPSLKNSKVGGNLVTGFLNPEDLEKLLQNIVVGDLVEDF